MKTCERCGNNFGCEIKSKDQQCWCKQAKPIRPIPVQYKDCLCPACLQVFAQDSGPTDLIEGEDFYLEKNLFVFTEKYHLDKGYCCENNCRHCPYK